MSRNFTAKISSEDKYLHLLNGVDSKNKRNAWWVIRVFVDKQVVFNSIIKKGNLRISDYGEILESGFGNDVPPTILAKYGFK